MFLLNENEEMNIYNEASFDIHFIKNFGRDQDKEDMIEKIDDVTTNYKNLTDKEFFYKRNDILSSIATIFRIIDDIASFIVFIPVVGLVYFLCYRLDRLLWDYIDEIDTKREMKKLNTELHSFARSDAYKKLSKTNKAKFDNLIEKSDDHIKQYNVR